MVESPQPASNPPPSAPEAQGRGWVALGLLLLVMPILLLLGGLGLFIYFRAEGIGSSFERVRKAEEEAERAQKQRRAEREAQLLAEFHDAFGRENLAAAGAVLERLQAEGFDSPAVAECRTNWEKAQQAREQKAGVPARPDGVAPPTQPATSPAQ